MNKEEIEDSPYCEICGTCGYLGCCGIRNFISNHIEGRTKCKNEELIIHELENLCDYKDEVFEENKQLQQENKQLKDNWDKLKDIIDVKMYNSEYLLNLCGYKIDADTLTILKIIKEEMQELEKGNINEME